MKKADIIVQLLSSDIIDKKILEVACGCAELSISAARYAHSVSCIDIDDSRLSNILPRNVCFEVMDASQMRYSSDSFDTIILYNAFSHIYSQWDSIKDECMRVLKSSGVIYIVSTWKLDISLMTEVFGSNAEWKKDFLVAKLKK
jgi:ubiquinone/menaquinone biosynthesis C-methylase UbiE